MNEEKRLKSIELCKNELTLATHDDVKAHYTELLDCLEQVNTPYKNYKVLIYFLGGIGDGLVQSLAFELFQIKYPQCIVDFGTEIGCLPHLFSENPYINNVRFIKDSSLVKNRQLEIGPIGAEYSEIHCLYNWDIKSMVKSYLEDMDLSTHYTKVRFYTNFDNDIKAYTALASNDPIICLQSDMVTTNKWDGDIKELETRLSEYGRVISLPNAQTTSYLEDASILKYADFWVGAHSSQEHLAAAVSDKIVCVSTQYKVPFDPSGLHVGHYQNPYRPEHLKHVCIKPKDTCGNYRCINFDVNQAVHKAPPEFNAHRFTPQMARKCDYGGYKNSCVRSITVDEIVEEFKKALNKWKIGLKCG